MRTLVLELVRVVEAAAVASAHWYGRGDKEEADGAAVQAMRLQFDSVEMKGRVVIGEGEMDEAPMLFIGEEVGKGIGPEVDIAVDPVEGTNLVASGGPGALSVLAAAPRGGLLHAPDMYMKKIAVGPESAGKVDLDRPLGENLHIVARERGKDIRELTVIMLDRPRHAKLVEEIRHAGARIRFLSDGDVSAAIAVSTPDSSIDLMVGQGGGPEGVLAAAALRCLGGELQGRLVAERPGEAERAVQMGIEPYDRLLRMEDLVPGDDVIFAGTGISDGEFLKGVKFLSNDRVLTHSLVMRSSTGTIRYMESIHQIGRKQNWTGIHSA